MYNTRPLCHLGQATLNIFNCVGVVTSIGAYDVHLRDRQRIITSELDNESSFFSEENVRRLQNHQAQRGCSRNLQNPKT